MGYDPYWPTCLATINTLVVPAGSIASSRFQEVFAALEAVNQVDIQTITEGTGGSSELINPSKFRRGTAILDITRHSEQGRSERNDLEPNAYPQAILGVYDCSKPRGSEGSLDLAAVRRRLQEAFSSEHDNHVFVLLVIGSSEIRAHEGIVELTDLEMDSTMIVIQHIFSLFYKRTCQSADTLADASFSDSVSTQQVSSESGQLNGVPDEDLLRARGKARHTITLGFLNLYLGAWPDALRRLAEGSVLAREVEDAIWQARALEALVLCMGLLVWKGVEFDVPDVCEQAYNTSQLLSKSSIFTRPTSSIAASQSTVDAGLSPAQKWLKYAPIVAEAVLTVYEKLSTSMMELNSSILLRESRIRSLNLLLFTSTTSKNTLLHDLDQFLTRKAHLSSINKTISSTIAGVNMSTQLFAALPITDEALISSDGIAATLAVVSCLSAMGSLRREAFILRGLLQRLAPALKSAKSFGASEAGVHPSAVAPRAAKGSSATWIESGLRSLISAATTAYGMVLPSLDGVVHSSVITKTQIEENLVSWCGQRSEGDLSLKAEILSLCIVVCDSIGDGQGSASLLSALLRLAIPNPTVSFSVASSALLISTSEQSRLLDHLKRLTARTHGIEGITVTAPYWNDFLVRDIQVSQSQGRPALVSHAPSELSLADDPANSQARDPFIFNPFARNTASQIAPVVIAGELVVFSVQLQNPLEVPVDVSDITLTTDGCDFEPSHHSVVLGASSSQIFSLSGRAMQAGSLKVVGCEATIEGCRRQRFPIMRASWQAPVKVKQRVNSRPPRNGAALFQPDDMKVSDPAVLLLTVIGPQPDLEIVSSSLTEPSLMLLEGEKRMFSLYIKNNSQDLASDFLLLTSTDNVSRGLRESLGRKDLMPIDTYEVQHQLKYRQAVQVGDTAVRQAHLEPQERGQYDFEVFGRPGLSDASVHVDFALLGQPRAEIKQTFYTRQIRFPLALTVNGSIEIVRCNILPIQGGLPSGFESRIKTAPNRTSQLELPAPRGTWSAGRDGLCMLSLDLRNVWPQPLVVQLTSFLSSKPQPEDAEHDAEDKYVTSETIQPGHVSRVIVIIPRLFVAEPFAPIPSLEKQRQFVVSASKMGHEAEASTRENFWYREELLKHVSGTWKEGKTGREGEIDLRKGIRLNLNARMIGVLRVDHVDISFSLKPNNGASAPMVKRLEDAHYQLQVESFATLCVTIRNLSKDRLPLLLRLQPCLREQAHSAALDLSRRLAWSGVLQQVLHPPLDSGDVREVELGLLVLAAGLYEVNATVEEVRPRSQTNTVAVDVLGKHNQRRIWHPRTPCFIDAFDAVEVPRASDDVQD